MFIYFVLFASFIIVLVTLLLVFGRAYLKKCASREEKTSISEVKVGTDVVAEAPQEDEIGKDVTAEPMVFTSRPLFTDTEVAFFKLLRIVVPAGYEVWGKLGLWALVQNKDKKGWTKISQKHLDFVVVSVRSEKPQAVLVIELDDPSHFRASTQARDAEKDAILKQAGIPTLRIPVRSHYSVPEIEAQVLGMLRRSDFKVSDDTE